MSENETPLPPQTSNLGRAYRDTATFFDDDTRIEAQDWAIDAIVALGFRPDDKDRTGEPVDNDVQTLMTMLVLKLPAVRSMIDPLRIRANKLDGSF